MNLKALSGGQSLVSWVRKCLEQGRPGEAFRLYQRNRGYVLSLIPLLVKACASLGLRDTGRSLHAESIKYGVESDVVAGTSLVGMYGKVAAVADARLLFDGMPLRNVVSWNAMIAGCFRSGDVRSASVLFKQMEMRSGVTWVEMIDGFARNGDLVTARRLFDSVPSSMRNVVTWTVMVEGYSKNGDMESAKEIFEVMPERNPFVWSSMITGYCNKSMVKEAKAIFNRITLKNLVNWNSLISGLSQNGLSNEALKAFEQMKSEGFNPDEITIVGVLSACAQSGSLEYGKKIHSMIKSKRINPNRFVLNALVDMYAKCGDLETATYIFEGMSHRNRACWNAMISGFALNGQSREALELFERMEGSSESLDELTFLTALSACAHGGFVDEGMTIFSKMEKYRIAPGVKHYGCLVDLLGRSGRLEEAYNMIKSMPMEPSDVVWGSLLGACRIHLDLDMAECIINEIKSQNCMLRSRELQHVLLSNIYAASENWEKAERLRVAMASSGVQKEPGCSIISC